MSQTTSYTLGELAQHIDASLIGNPDYSVKGLNTLLNATPEQLSFLSNKAYRQYLPKSKAGCVILMPDDQTYFSGNKLVTKNPYYAFALTSELFGKLSTSIGPHIHKTLVQGNDCQIADKVDIGANVVLGNNVTLGDGVSIGAGCFIGDNTIIESNVRLHPNVVIYANSCIGKNSIIHSHAVIGSDGFGYAPKPGSSGEWKKIYQLGGVDIGCDVEIGAGTTIDRGALDNTVIGNGVKLDNQIQIAHNVVIGENTAIAGATAIAGSTVIGKRCTIAGAVGIIGHLTIADDVHITAMTLVTKSIRSSGSYSSGTPLNNTSQWRKNAARFNRLDELVRQLKISSNND